MSTKADYSKRLAKYWAELKAMKNPDYKDIIKLRHKYKIKSINYGVDERYP